MSTSVHVYLEYEQMLKSFRCQDLANLLASAGQSKNGKKSELYDRCISILKKGNVNVQTKIRDLYNQLQGQKTYTTGPYGTNYISGINSNSNSSTSNSPDPNMINGSGNSTGAMSNSNGGSQRYQPTTNHGAAMMGMQLPGTSFNPMMAHNGAMASTNGTNSIGLRSGQPVNNNLQNLHVQFEKLPFFNHLCEIYRPTRMNFNSPNQRVHAYNFNFSMTADQVSQITTNRELVGGKLEYTKQVHLRFGYFENSIQSDNLPPNLLVNVNGKPAQLPTPKPTSKPNADIIRPGRTIEITPICKLAPNVINRVEINWSVGEPNKSFCVGVFMFEKVNVDTLVKNLKANGVKSADVTLDMIKQKLHIGDDDFEIETNTYKVSLLCPLMKFRMQIPSRSTKCRHAQCFNLESYLQMNEKKPTWNCPVCDQNASYDTLMIDSLFVSLLEQCKDCDEVEFNADGSWTRCDNKEKSSSKNKMNSSSSGQNTSGSKAADAPMDEDCVDLDESLMIANDPVPQPIKAAPSAPATTSAAPSTVQTTAASKEAECIDLTLDSDEEDNNAASKRPSVLITASRPPPLGSGSTNAAASGVPNQSKTQSATSGYHSPTRNNEASGSSGQQQAPASPCASIISLSSSSSPGKSSPSSRDSSPSNSPRRSQSPTVSKHQPAGSSANHENGSKAPATQPTAKSSAFSYDQPGMASSVGPSSNNSSVNTGVGPYTSEDSRSVGPVNYAPLSVLTVDSLRSSNEACNNDDNSKSSDLSSTLQNASPDGLMITPPPIMNPSSVDSNASNDPTTTSNTALNSAKSSTSQPATGLLGQLSQAMTGIATNAGPSGQHPPPHLIGAGDSTSFDKNYRNSSMMNFADDNDVMMRAFESPPYQQNYSQPQQQPHRPSSKPSSSHSSTNNSNNSSNNSSSNQTNRTDLHNLVNDANSKVTNSKLPHRRPVLSKEMMLKCAEESGIRPGSPNSNKRPMANSANYHIRDPIIQASKIAANHTSSSSSSTQSANNPYAQNNQGHSKSVSPGSSGHNNMAPNNTKRPNYGHSSSSSYNSQMPPGQFQQKSPGSSHLDSATYHHKQLTKTNSHPSSEHKHMSQRPPHMQSAAASSITNGPAGSQPFFINKPPGNSHSNYNSSNTMQRNPSGPNSSGSTSSSSSSSMNISPSGMHHHHHGQNQHHHGSAGHNNHHSQHHQPSSKPSSTHTTANPGQKPSSYSNSHHSQQQQAHGHASGYKPLTGPPPAVQSTAHHHVPRPVPYPDASSFPIHNRVHPSLNPYSQKF